jgi:peptidoglycan/LPS O-acetylase OafA/YrhL
MGWIGVDLFFVLSGFLVSGLLFKEYIKFGNIKAGRFLIRRGLKIYPIYYLFYIVYLIPMFLNHSFSRVGILADLLFIQNYVSGLGYAFSASWSLAVEEHFYFALAIFLWLALKNKWLELKVENNNSGLSSFEKVILLIMSICFTLRLISNLYFHDDIRNLYYFRIEKLTTFFNKYKLQLFAIAVLGLLWTPFIDPMPSFFAKTIGFSLLYISFGILLISFLLVENINQNLNKIFTQPLVATISRIGYCSYSIYIIHLFIIRQIERYQATHPIIFKAYIYFAVSFTLSIIAGMLMTYVIERYFLKMRDKYFPSRIACKQRELY